MSNELNERINEQYRKILNEQSYKEFFDSKLKEWGVNSPKDLDDKKRINNL